MKSRSRLIAIKDELVLEERYKGYSSVEQKCVKD